MTAEKVTWGRRGDRLPRLGIYGDTLIEGLTELSDEQTQRESWSVGPASPVEAMEQVFSDSGLSHVLERADAAQLLTPELVAALETLRTFMRGVDLDRAVDEILDDPALALARTAAARALVLVRGLSET